MTDVETICKFSTVVLQNNLRTDEASPLLYSNSQNYRHELCLNSDVSIPKALLLTRLLSDG